MIVRHGSSEVRGRAAERSGEGTFAIVPVIDIRHGLVVRARAGDRASYGPIRTPLCESADPVDVARALLRAVPAQRLYIADLDAIEGRAANREALRRIARACAPIELWVDAGFSTEAATAAFLDEGIGRPVLGTESQRDETLVRSLGDGAVLSLDSRGDAPLGPARLHEDASLWPRDVIVMTLARVGSGAGPDLGSIAEAKRRAPDARVFAAGGLRGPEDIGPLIAAGAAGALVASAIHDGRLRREDLRAPP
jgi:phosphoribosylformimino-5-aminoimidazole carboxamide ribotide isomerase